MSSLLLLLGLGAARVGAAESQPPVGLSVHSARYDVQLVGWERIAPEYQALSFRFRTLDHQTKTERFFTVQNQTTALNRATIAGDLFVLFGDVQGLATGITVVNLKEARTLDFLLSYGGTVSPDGKSLCYLQFYPRHAPPQVQSDVLVARALETSAKTLEVAKPRALYPEENVRPADLQAWVDDPGERHRIDQRAGFLWLQDPLRLVFVDFYQGGPGLVVIDVSNGIETARAQRIPIDVGAALAQRDSEQERAKLLQRERSAFAISRIESAPEGKLRLVLSRTKFDEGLYRVTEILMDVPTAPSSAR